MKDHKWRYNAKVFSLGSVARCEFWWCAIAIGERGT